MERNCDRQGGSKEQRYIHERKNEEGRRERGGGGRGEISRASEFNPAYACIHIGNNEENVTHAFMYWSPDTRQPRNEQLSWPRVRHAFNPLANRCT